MSWSAFERVVRRTISTANLIAISVAFLVSFLIIFDVSRRYLFNSPLTGTYEIVHSLLVLVVFFGIAYTQSTRGHIRIELIDRYLSPRQSLCLEITVYSICLIFFLTLTWTSWDVALNAIITGEYSGGAVHIPIYPAKTIITLGALLMSLQFIVDIVNDIRKLKTAGGGVS